MMRYEIIISTPGHSSNSDGGHVFAAPVCQAPICDVAGSHWNLEVMTISSETFYGTALTSVLYTEKPSAKEKE